MQPAVRYARASAPEIPPPLPPSAPIVRRVARTVVRIVRGLQALNAFEVASSVAFKFFLSLVPMLVLLGFVLGHLVRHHQLEEYAAPLLDVVPPSAVPLVLEEIDRLAAARRVTLAPLSIAGFLWLTASGAHNLMDIVETAVGASRRAWWKQRALALAWVIAMLAACAAAAFGLRTADRALHPREPRVWVAGTAPSASEPEPVRPTRIHGAHAHPPPSEPWNASAMPSISAAPPDAGLATPGVHHFRHVVHEPWERYAALSIALALTLGLLALYYWLAVERPRGFRRRYWPGAFVAVVSGLAVSWAFGAYVRSLDSYTVYYGSLAAVAVLLVWLYLASLALLLGAEVNAQLEGVRDVPPSSGTHG